MLLLVLGCACVSKDERGNINIDLRGCQAPAKVDPPPALKDGTISFATGDANRTPVAALAFAVHEQEAVSLVVSTAPLRCADVSITPSSRSVSNAKGVVVDLTVAPIAIDSIWDQSEVSHSIAPAQESWRVTKIFAPTAREPRGAFWTWMVSNVDVARGAATTGKHTPLRMAVSEHRLKVEKVKNESFAGTLDVEGCGEIAYTKPARPQPELAVSIGPRHYAMRGATYRLMADGGGELVIATAPSDCKGSDGPDLEILIRRDNVAIFGNAVTTSFNYNSPGINVRPVALSADGGAADDGGAPSTIRLQVSGALYRPLNGEGEPRDELERLEYARNVHVAGIVEALVCPPETKK